MPEATGPRSARLGGRRALAGSAALLAALLLVVAFTARAGAIVFVQEWGGTGAGPGQFDNPSGIAVDGTGDVYVVDSLNNRVQKFSEAGAFLQQWTGSGIEGGDFLSPIGIAAHGGSVYVLDGGNNRVQQFTTAGAFLHEWGTTGQSPDALNKPEGIAVDSTGAVYVADTGNRRIVKFTGGGSYLTHWGTEGGSPGEFQAPRGIATDAADNVFVSDPGNDRVQKFTDGGVFLHEWGTTGSGNGQFRSPSGIAIDPAGTVYVADAGNDRVQAFDTGGLFLAAWGTEGTGPGQFHVPTGVADGLGGKVFVTDAGNNRVQVFGPDPVIPIVGPPPALTDPVYGKTVNVFLVSGVVKVKLPGSRKFILLTADRQIPVGTVIDATRGRVKLVAAKNAGGATQSAEFYEGIFRVLQPRGGKAVTVLKLEGKLLCGRTDHLSATASRRKRRGLWGSGKGNFRSEGRHGSATVRGTIWWAQDRCDGTMFKVKKGVVTIKDFSSGKTLKLTAGEQYLAPAG